MKVVLIFRKYKLGANSMEEIFHCLAKELAQHVEIIEYEARGRWMIIADIWRLWRLQADIYHVTGDINYFVNLLPRKKSILTVHDIGHFLYSLTGIKRWLYKWLWLILPMRAAVAITTVSTATKTNIIEFLNICENKLSVINNCYNRIYTACPKAFNHTCPVILQVGTKAYKNVPRLIEALYGLNCQLVLIGKIDSQIQQKLINFPLDYKNYVDLTHEELYQCYCDCDIVSFVSIGEGFGVPIIESQVVGRAIITTNISPMCDVAGDGACLVPALDVLQIRQGIMHIINDDNYRDSIIRKGFINAAKYSPAVIQDKYYDLYTKVIANY